MFDTVIVLCDVPSFVRFLEDELRKHNADIFVLPVEDLRSLRAVPAERLAQSRLVGVTTGVIVPNDLLQALGYGAYNFHPGPPEYPGWDPIRFALYDNAREFGVTAHVMAAQIDAGAIVGLRRFAVKADPVYTDLQAGMVDALKALIEDLAKDLAISAAGPSPVGDAWAPKKTRRDAAALCDIPLQISEVELRRRINAFGSGDLSLRPQIKLHGARFIYVPDQIFTTP